MSFLFFFFTHLMAKSFPVFLSFTMNTSENAPLRDREKQSDTQERERGEAYHFSLQTDVLFYLLQKSDTFCNNSSACQCLTSLEVKNLHLHLHTTLQNTCLLSASEVEFYELTSGSINQTQKSEV